MPVRSAPGGVGRKSCLLVLFLVTLYVVAVVGHNGPHKPGERCVPWLCSCFYRGVYYDEGDTWDDHDDPCMKFQCLENGYFQPIKAGCSFKGTCHDMNSTWREGCFLYKCHSNYVTSGYQLEEAACTWKDGNCYKVGQRTTEHCDVYECQIDNGCYVMNKVKSGCKTGLDATPCKPIYSFWQDECAVYQCVGEEKSNLKSRVQLHNHDVMMWPRGHYALPQPFAGCPIPGEKFWYDGMYRQCGDGCNYKSQEFYLKGDYNQTEFEHNFCVHHDVDDPEIIPLYQTYWEPGRYCIYRYNGSCPKGFSEGFVEMTNTACNGSNLTTTGRLPDGIFTDNITRLEFCCRFDGEIKHPIVLPAKHPFVLFMATNESECQEVQGMNVKNQFWSFCDTEDGKNRQLNGSLPLIKTGDNNTLINFCVYTPIGCGCTDEDESVVAIGDSVKRDCVTKECKTIYKYNIMVVTEGGCYDDVNEVCRAENETWTDMIGEMCVDKECLRKTDETTTHGENVTFEIVTVRKACRDGDKCVPLKFTKVKGCYTTECQEDPQTGEASFVVTKAGCSNGHGRCIPDGSTFTDRCVQVKCDRSKSKCGLSIVKGECSYQKKCYSVGSVFTHYCTDYVCHKIRTKKGYTWKFLPREPVSQYSGCVGPDRKCYKPGYKLHRTCEILQCVIGERTGFVRVWAGCKVTINNKTICVPPNQKLEHCSTYRCQIFENGDRKLVCEQRRCSYDNKCYEPGDIIDNRKKCVTYKCLDGGKRKLINIGCGYKGKCYPANKTFVDGCSTFICNVNSTHRGVKHIELACKVGNKCIPPGQLFNYNCAVYKCSEDKLSCTAHLIEQGCRNAKGECIKNGHKETINPYHTYYCVLKTCLKGRYSSELACRDADGKCIRVKDTGPQMYTIDHGGQRKQAKCSYDKEKKLIKISLG